MCADVRNVVCELLYPVSALPSVARQTATTTTTIDGVESILVILRPCCRSRRVEHRALTVSLSPGGSRPVRGIYICIYVYGSVYLLRYIACMCCVCSPRVVSHIKSQSSVSWPNQAAIQHSVHSSSSNFDPLESQSALIGRSSTYLKNSNNFRPVPLSRLLLYILLCVPICCPHRVAWTISHTQSRNHIASVCGVSSWSCLVAHSNLSSVWVSQRLDLRDQCATEKKFYKSDFF